MAMSPTQTTARVQTPGGQTIGLNAVKSIRLNDGWHKLNDCKVSYQQNGRTETVPFSEIQGFSDVDESGGGSQNS